VALDGGPVTPGHRTSQGGRGPERGHVVDRGSYEVEIGVERDAGHGRQAGHLGEQGDRVVGGDAGCRVIGGPVSVGYLDEPATEVGDDGLHGAVTRHREPGAGGQGAGAGVRGRQGDERVKRRPATVRGQHVEPERSRKVDDQHILVTPNGRGHLGYGVIGGGDDAHVNAGGRPSHVLTPADEASHIPPAPRKGSGQ
jgi:hypothetical protein